jgi:hypothetical protein
MKNESTVPLGAPDVRPATSALRVENSTAGWREFIVPGNGFSNLMEGVRDGKL